MKQLVINFFKIIRWKNVLIYFLLQFLLYFSFFNKNFSIKDGWLFLTLSFILFGIFGNIHNNIIDYELDKKKKNFIKFNKTNYLIWAIIFLILGLIFGFASFYLTFSPTLLYSIFLFPTILTLYNFYLKKLPLIGNIIIAFLVTLAIYSPIAHAKKIEYHNDIFYFLLIMSFLLTLIREIIKDIEDAKIDILFKHKTLPIISKKITFLTYILLNILYAIVLFKYKNSFSNLCFNTLTINYIILLIISIKFFKENKYHKISSIIKFTMLTGILVINILC